MFSFLDYYFPPTFLALALAHFVALISPGADFFLIVGQSIRHGFKNSIWICVGIALANGVYIVLTILGWSAIRNYPSLFLGIEISGAVYLLWIGSLFIRSSKRSIAVTDKRHQSKKSLSLFKQLVMGFLSGILNPKNFIFYVSLMTSILGNQVTLVQQMTCGLWMFFAVLLWDILIAYAIAHPKFTHCLMNKIYLIERSAGVILILISAGIIYRVLSNFLY